MFVVRDILFLLILSVTFTYIMHFSVFMLIKEPTLVSWLTALVSL